MPNPQDWRSNPGSSGGWPGFSGPAIPEFGNRSMIESILDILGAARSEKRKYGEIYDRNNQVPFSEYARSMGLSPGGSWGQDPAALQSARGGYDAYNLGQANIMNQQDQTDSAYWGQMYGLQQQGDMGAKDRANNYATAQLNAWMALMQEALRNSKGFPMS